VVSFSFVAIAQAYKTEKLLTTGTCYELASYSTVTYKCCTFRAASYFRAIIYKLATRIFDILVEEEKKKLRIQQYHCLYFGSCFIVQ